MPALHLDHRADPEEHPAIVRPDGGLVDLFGAADATVLLETPPDSWGFVLAVLVVDADPRSVSMALTGDGVYRAFTVVCQNVDVDGFPKPLAIRAELVPLMTEGWTIHRRLLVEAGSYPPVHATFSLWGLQLIADALGLSMYQSSCPMPDPSPAGSEAWLNHRVDPHRVTQAAPGPRTWRMP